MKRRRLATGLRLVEKELVHEAGEPAPFLRFLLQRLLARHFGEVTQADFAAWAEPFLEDQKSWDLG